MANRIVLLCAERSRRQAVGQLCWEYLERLERYNLRATVEECTRAAGAHRADQSAWLLGRITADDYVVLLDQRGTVMDSASLARMFDRALATAPRRVVFVIGGAYGVTPAVRERADVVLSLGMLTLPHELARIVLCEQLYRAMTILRGEPYHHGANDG
jgi:23S rRNA (pseudouridine1915-N3)-methyltransferase